MEKRELFRVRFSAHVLAMMAMLIALNIILTRFLSIMITDSMRIGFGFLPVAIAGMLLGPIPAMLVGAVGDLIGTWLFPSGPYFFGFTLTAMLGGLVYGLCLYQKPVRLGYVLLAKLLIDAFLNLGLNTLWINLLYGKAILALLPARAMKNLVQYPIDVALLYMVLLLITRIPKSFVPKMK